MIKPKIVYPRDNVGRRTWFSPEQMAELVALTLCAWHHLTLMQLRSRIIAELCAGVPSEEIADSLVKIYHAAGRLEAAGAKGEPCPTTEAKPCSTK